MDILIFFKKLPCKIVHFFLLVLHFLFGEISWHAPKWSIWIKNVVSRHRRITIGVFLVIGLSGASYYWWENRTRPLPKGPVYSATLIQPITQYVRAKDAPLALGKIRITFGGSVAPIEAINAPIKQGITMNPQKPGEWRWVNDREIVFTPKSDWLPSEVQRVVLDPKILFAPQKNVNQVDFIFTNRQFLVTNTVGEFYQNPKESDLRKTMMTLVFSHPVDSASLESQLKLVEVQNPNSENNKRLIERKFTVTYDSQKLRAYIHSENLALLANNAHMALELKQNVLLSSVGGKPYGDKINVKVNIPNLYDLNIQRIEPMIVADDAFSPSYTLIIVADKMIDGQSMKGAVEAYILPKNHPNTTLDPKQNNKWDWRNGQVTDSVLKGASRVVLEKTDSDSRTMQTYRIKAAQNDQVYIRVKKGIAAFGGYQLGEDVERIITMPPFAKVIDFMGDGALLSLKNEKKIGIISYNIPEINVQIGRVLPSQLQHIATLSNGNFMNPNVKDSFYDFGKENILEYFNQKLTISKDEVSHNDLDLSKYLGKLGDYQKGVFWITISENNLKKNTDENDTDNDTGNTYDDANQAPVKSRIILVTDLGILAKKSLDDSRDVYIQSIETGDPIANAVVDVVSKNGQVIYTKNTDETGHVHFDALSKFTREKEAVMYRVTKDDDMSFLPISSTNIYRASDRELDYSRFEIGGLDNILDPGALSAWLFSDRGIYRPGERIDIGMIVRALDFSKSLVGIPVMLELINAKGTVQKKEMITLSEHGLESFSYQTSPNDPTGEWSVILSLPRDLTKKTSANVDDNEYDELIILGSTTIQVKEFKPDTMKINLRLMDNKKLTSKTEGWYKPEEIKAHINVQNLFGTPAQNRVVKGAISLQPAYQTFSAYTDYQFYDSKRIKNSFEDNLQDMTTDQQGDAKFDLDLQRFANSSYQLRFLGTAYEAGGGRNVSAQSTIMVSNHPFLIGSKADGNLSYIPRDTKRSINLIAIDSDVQKMLVTDITLSLSEYKYISVLTKQDSGLYKYVSRRSKIDISDQIIDIVKEGLDYSLPTDKPGEFELSIKDRNGNLLNLISFTVIGDANLSRSLERNAELGLTLSKTEYAPGEEIEVSINAPYTGSGLITIEREKVFSHVWFRADTTSSIQRIRVPDDFEGNGYINVQFIRDINSEAIFMSPMSYGIKPFKTNTQKRHLNLDISFPKVLKPGETLNMTVSKSNSPSTEKARAIVFAIDEGILQVARYQLGKPLDYFFRKRSLDVSTSQILDLILPSFSKLIGLKSAAGGDDNDTSSRHQNPFKRKTDAPVAFWSGVIDLSDEQTLSYTIPSYFNGKMRVMAVAVTGDRIGTFQSSITVRNDVVLSPNVPFVVAPGDEFDVSVGISNNITPLNSDQGSQKGNETIIDLTLMPSEHLAIIGEKTQSVVLKEGAEAFVNYKVRALEVLGSASFQFEANYLNSKGEASTEKRVATSSVRPSRNYRHQSDTGFTQLKQLQFNDIRDLFPAHATRTVSASFSPLILVQGLSAYLGDFAHACTEQLISKAIPNLVLSQYPELVDKRNSINLDELLNTLRTRQNLEGGFGTWQASTVVDPFITPYVVSFLLEIQNRDAASVPKDMLDLANNYLREIAVDDYYSELYQLRTRAMAIYLLTLQGEVTTNYLAQIQKKLDDGNSSWKSDLTAVWLASSYQLLQQSDIAEPLMQSALKSLSQSQKERWSSYDYYDPLIKDAMSLYLIEKHFPTLAEKIPPAALDKIGDAIKQNKFTTLSSAILILALDKHARGLSKSTLDTDLIISQMRDKPLQINNLKLSVSEGKPTKDKSNVDLEKIASMQGLLSKSSFAQNSVGLQIDNPNQLPVWYVVEQSGFNRTESPNAIKNGLEIVRNYTDAFGKILDLDKIELGEEVDVHIKVRSTDDEYINNIAIIDLLPGGFEVVLQEKDAAPEFDENGNEMTVSSNNKEGENGGNPSGWRSSIAVGEYSWQPDFTDIREDRVMIYGSANSDIQEFVYRIRATNTGTFTIPAAYGEALYDRSIFAQSAAGGIIKVIQKTLSK